MTGSTSAVRGSDRLVAPDVLRGVALFGILVVNLPFFAHPIYEVAVGGQVGHLLDQAATWVVAFAFQAKFYVLFSFLFGYGLAVQLLRSRERGDILGPRYARRLIGLLAFGLLHAVFLFVGDILVSYVFLGVFLWLLRDWRPRTLVGVAGVMMALAVVGRVVLALSGLEGSGTDGELLSLTEAAHRNYLGSFMDGTRQRLQDLVVFYIFTPLFNWPTAMAMFALGLAAGKVGMFTNLDQFQPLIRRIFPWVSLLGIGGNFLYATLVEVSPTGWIGLALSTLEALAAPAMTFMYVIGVLEVVRRVPAPYLSPLQAAGRTSLTNYLGQAVVCSFLFNGWGLGLYGQVGAFGLVLLALAVFAAQLFFSVCWLRRFRYGPDEWLLRSWTYLRWQPWRAPK